MRNAKCLSHRVRTDCCREPLERGITNRDEMTNNQLNPHGAFPDSSPSFSPSSCSNTSSLLKTTQTSGANRASTKYPLPSQSLTVDRNRPLCRRWKRESTLRRPCTALLRRKLARHHRQARLHPRHGLHRNLDISRTPPPQPRQSN
jgi:hypothetical protein